MKNLLIGGLIVSVLLIGAPAMVAGDDPGAFFAFSKLSGNGNAPLPQKMSDEHLASVEGGAICIGCPNIAVVIQPNILVQTLVALGNDISQSAVATLGNRANIGQTQIRR